MNTQLLIMIQWAVGKQNMSVSVNKLEILRDKTNKPNLLLPQRQDGCKEIKLLKFLIKF